jgi:hypothetical protein
MGWGVVAEVGPEKGNPSFVERSHTNPGDTFAQLLHNFSREFRFAQSLHTMNACTEFAHYFLLEFAHKIANYIDSVCFCLLLYGQ